MVRVRLGICASVEHIDTSGWEAKISGYWPSDHKQGRPASLSRWSQERCLLYRDYSYYEDRLSGAGRVLGRLTVSLRTAPRMEGNVWGDVGNNLVMCGEMNRGVCGCVSGWMSLFVCMWGDVAFSWSCNAVLPPPCAPVCSAINQ